MADSVVTQPSLLIRIRDPNDDAAWRQFVRLYAPLVYGFARRRGLQDADASDLVQDVLQQAAHAAERFDYDRQRGTFRGWLFQVCSNRLNNWLRGQRSQTRGSGDSDVQGLLEQQRAPANESAEWDREYERRLFDLAAQQIRGEVEPKSWSAFLQTAVEGRPVQEVAAGLNMSVGAVYVAKSRIVARLRAVIQQLEE